MNEKEVIETYKNFLDDISKNGGCTIDIDFQHKKEYEAMWKILNILKEQQEEIEKYKMLLTRTNAQFINDTIETGKKNKEDLEMLYAGCQEEVEKKDKIIQDSIQYIEDTFELEEEKCITDLYNILTKK